MQAFIDRVLLVENGFKPIEFEAKKIIASTSIIECRELANDLIKSEFYQVRSLGVFILGFIAMNDLSVLPFLKQLACNENSWQVQEILAKAFDQYCKDIGYEKALPNIKDWLANENPNVCRVVTEGLRIWTGRPYFKTNPDQAIQLLSKLKANESVYLRKSVGNALRDISKKHKHIIQKELDTWDLSDKRIKFTYNFVIKPTSKKC